jgi:hypothetical protein
MGECTIDFTKSRDGDTPCAVKEGNFVRQLKKRPKTRPKEKAQIINYL